MEETTAISAFKSILFYSLIILFAPIMTFFSVKYLLFEGLFSSDNNVVTNVWSAVFAVVVLHAALGLYIYKAYFQEPEKFTRKPSEKQE